MKVVLVNSVSGYGSTGKIVNELSEGLDRENIENYVFYGRKSSSFKNAIRIGSNLNVISHLLFTRVFGKHGFYSKFATKRFVKKLAKIKPDLVHLHNLHGYYLNVEILFKYLKKADIKVVWTLHDCWSFTGHCAHYDYVDCQKWQSQCYNCPQTKVYYKSWFFDRSKEAFLDKKQLFNFVDNLTIISPSLWLKNEVTKSYLSSYPVKVIYNGINLDVFKPTISTFRNDYNLNDKFIVLGVSSVWSERKGLNYFIDLANNLNADEVLVLVGLSESQIKVLPDNIIKISRTNSQAELAAIYSACDVYVNLSLEETLGLTNIEALACGSPVIAFNAGGSPEVLDKDSGIVVKRGDLSGVLAAIKLVKDKPQDFYKLACLRRAKENFNQAAIVTKHLDLYNKIYKDEA